MYKFLKFFYKVIPGKVYVYNILRTFYKPSNRISGYLKFKGIFSVKLDDNKRLRILNDFSTLPSIIFWNGLNSYEKSSLEIWRELSYKSSVTLDVGANFGLFGLLSKVENPNSKVIFVEPLERNADRIRRNLRLNQFDAKVLVSALGDKVGFITFFDMDSSENTIGSIDEEFVEMHKHSTQIIPLEVPMITIDDLVKTEGLKNVDLIKMDVEGADYLSIKGSLKTLNTFKPNILIEITNHENGQKISQFLKSLNFKYYSYEISETKGLISCEEIIREGDSRNYLLSALNRKELMLTYPKLNKNAV